MSYPFCPRCNYVSKADNAKFCTQCGSPTMDIACPGCKSPLYVGTDADIFCDQCGISVVDHVAKERVNALISYLKEPL